MFGYVVWVFSSPAPSLRLSPWGCAEEERAQRYRVPSIHIARKVLNGRRVPSPPAGAWVGVGGNPAAPEGRNRALLGPAASAHSRSNQVILDRCDDVE